MLAGGLLYDFIFASSLLYNFHVFSLLSLLWLTISFNFQNEYIHIFIYRKHKHWKSFPPRSIYYPKNVRTITLHTFFLFWRGREHGDTTQHTSNLIQWCERSIVNIITSSTAKKQPFPPKCDSPGAHNRARRSQRMNKEKKTDSFKKLSTFRDKWKTPVD